MTRNLKGLSGIRSGKTFFFVLLLLSLLFISPVSAEGNYTSLDVWTTNAGTMTFTDVQIVDFDTLEYSSSAVSEITFSGIKPGTYDLVFTQSNGNAHSGQIVYDTSGVLGTSGNWSLEMDGYSHEWSGINVELLGKMYIATYAQDIDTDEKGIILIDGWVGNTIIGTITGDYNCVFAPVATIEAYPITEVQIIGSDTFTVSIGYGDYEDVAAEISEDDLSVWGWIGNLMNFVGNISNLLFSLITAFKFIVIDHWFSLIVFYESVILAYSASKSRDIFTLSRKIFRYNKALFEVILGFISIIIQIFHNIIDTIKP